MDLLTKKPAFDDIYMDLAINLSKRSHCIKRQVGAVLVKETRIISIGYNGPPSGTHNCDEEWPETGCPRDSKGSCSLAIHAEQNAILYAVKNGTSIENSTLYVTLSPCISCARIIYSSKIQKVIYLHSYAAYKGIPMDEGVDFLRKFGVQVQKYEPGENFKSESLQNTLIEIKKDLIIQSFGNRTITVDVFFPHAAKPMPVVIYTHGFKGFKDWGNFDMIAKAFANAGFIFVKYNFSLNGIPEGGKDEFTELEKFGSNNASHELEDLQKVVEWVNGETFPVPLQFIQKEEIYLIGHSRGAGVCLVTAAEQPTVKKLISWAGITTFGHVWKNFTTEDFNNWKESGVTYTLNGRTGQQMPLYYQLYEDFQQNAGRLDIEKTGQLLGKPWLICHGTEDEAVSFEAAENLHLVSPGSIFHPVHGANHVFGRKHPWDNPDLPADTRNIVDRSIAFLKSAI